MVHRVGLDEIATLRSQQVWTVAIRSVGLQEFAVLTVERKDC